LSGSVGSISGVVGSPGTGSVSVGGSFGATTMLCVDDEVAPS
jgi:hypothetical protein